MQVISMAESRGGQPTSAKAGGKSATLVEFFRVKFAKEADAQLVDFLEKVGPHQELPSQLVKPALILLGISSNVATLSDAQVLECVERNSRSLMKDLNDFKAGDKQQIAERAKNVVSRLTIVLQSPAAIRAALATPIAKPLPQAKAAPAAEKPTTSTSAPMPKVQEVTASTHPAAVNTKTVAPLAVPAPTPTLPIVTKPAASKSRKGPATLVIVVAVGGVVAVCGLGLIYLSLQPGKPTVVAEGSKPPINANKPTPPKAPLQKPLELSPANQAIASVPAQASPMEKPAAADVVMPPAETSPPPTIQPPLADPNPAQPQPTTQQPAIGANSQPAVSQQPPAEPKIEIDQQEFKRMRTSLQEVTKDIPEGERVDAILAFANNPETLKSPAAMKAVIAEALVQSVATKDAVRAGNTLRRLRNSAQLFTAEELSASITVVLNFATSSGERDLARELIAELQERGELSQPDAFAKRVAILRSAAQDKSKKLVTPEQRIKLAEEMLALAREGADVDSEAAEGLVTDSRKTAGLIANKELRIAFDKDFTSARTVVNEAKRLKQAVDQLAADPNNEAAKKTRLEILIGRGKIKEVLTDLAGSDHPLRGLAQQTDLVLKQGVAAEGTSCFACAQLWAKQAEQATYENNLGIRQLTHELLVMSIAATEGKLDPFALQKAKQLEVAFTSGELVSNTPTVNAPPTATKPENPPRSKLPNSAVTVDLLDAEKVSFNVLVGKAERVKSAIVEDRGVVEFQHQPSATSFRLRSSFVRTSGGDTVAYTFPVGTKSIALTLGVLNDAFTGLCDINRKGADNNGTGLRLGLQNGRLYGVQIDVLQLTETDYRIVALLDGEKIVDWSGSQEVLAPQPHYAGSSHKTFLVGARNCGMELRSLELSFPGNKPTRGERTKTSAPESVAGTYVVRYASGAKRTYRIDDAGNVLYVETKQITQLVKRGDDLILDFKDGKIERVTLGAGTIRVDHFDPGSNYPNGRSLVGTGARE
jgi:hypothetical protein